MRAGFIEKGLPVMCRLAFFGLAMLFVGATLAATTTTTSSTSIGSDKLLCPDADIWGEKLIDGICWSCIFPVRLLGATVAFEKNGGEVPDGATRQILCTCYDPLGVPEIGLTAAMWAPARLIEVVRKPYCSPILGGTSLQSSVRLWGGHKSLEQDASDKTFYNYHYWAFPLYTMMELLLQSNCNAGGYRSLDLMYLSEVDPLWNEDELAFFLNPEAVVFANPLAMAACSVDCAVTSVGKPMESLFWCAGCWGNLYPLTGNIASEASPPRDTSLLAARITAGLHRRGMAWKTYGDAALCGGYIYPMLPKQQYRMSTLFPVAEAAEGHCCHYIGETPFKWGEWRTIPGVGEDYVYLLWRYTECCLD